MISAILLAAGQSRRMGQPKMLLPWGNVTVLEHVISVFAAAEIEDILVVTGAVHEQLEQEVARLAKHHPVRVVYNPDYLHGEMLSSIQHGLGTLIPEKKTAAALVALGDQPQVQERSIRLVCEAFLRTESNLVVPSYEMRRGHPWLVARPFWEDLLSMHHPNSPRDFLNSHADHIQYVNVNTPSILADLDTPEDYRAAHP